MPLYQVDVDGQTVEFDSPVDLTPDQIDAEVAGIRSQLAPPAAPEEAPGYLSQLFTSLYQGGRQALGGARTAFNALTGDTADMAAGLQQQAEAQRALQEAQTPEDVAFLEDLNKQAEELKQARGFLPTLSEAIDLPMAALRQPGAALKTAVQSLPNALISTPITLGAGVLGTAAGGLVGLPTTGPGAIATGIAGGIAAGTAANTALEAGSEIYQRFVERIGDPAGMTREQIAAALDQNPDIASEGLKTGLTRGAVIGTIETLGLKGAGALLAAPERAAIQATRQVLTRSGVDLADDAAVRAAMATPEMAKATKAAADAARAGFNVPARAAGAGAIEIGASGVGEALAQQAAGQETDYADVFLEMLGEGVAAAPSVLAARGVELAGTGIQAVREQVLNRTSEVMGDAMGDIGDLIDSAGASAAGEINRVLSDAATPVVRPPAATSPVVPPTTSAARQPSQIPPPPFPIFTDATTVDEIQREIDQRIALAQTTDFGPDGDAQLQADIDSLQIELTARTGALTPPALAPATSPLQTPVQPSGGTNAGALMSAAQGGLERAFRNRMRDRISKGETVIFTRLDSIEAARNNPFYITQDLPDGTVQIVGVRPESDEVVSTTQSLPTGQAQAPAPGAATQPTPPTSNEVQIPEAGGLPPVQGQPPVQAPAVQTPEGAALGGREGQEGQVTPEPVQPMGAAPAPATESVPQELADWDRDNRNTRGDEWFTGGHMVNRAFEAAASAGADQLQAHGMAKEATLSGGLRNLLNLLRNGVDPKRGGGQLYTAQLAKRKGQVGVQGATASGTAYRDGPFVLVQNREASQAGLGIRNVNEIAAVLVNEANIDQLDAIRSAIQSVNPNIIVAPYSEVGAVTQQILNQPLPPTGGVPTASLPADTQPTSGDVGNALRAVAANTATPEQVASLEAQGLARTVQGQPVITDAGLARMPEAERPRLTEAERVAEIQQQTQNEAQTQGMAPGQVRGAAIARPTGTVAPTDVQLRRELDLGLRTFLSAGVPTPQQTERLGISPDGGGATIPWPTTRGASGAALAAGVAAGPDGFVQASFQNLRDLAQTFGATIEVGSAEGSPLSVSSQSDGSLILRIDPSGLANAVSIANAGDAAGAMRTVSTALYEEFVHLADLAAQREAWVQSGIPDFNDFLAGQAEAAWNDIQSLIKTPDSGQQIRQILNRVLAGSNAIYRGWNEASSDEDLLALMQVGRVPIVSVFDELVRQLAQENLIGTITEASVFQRIVDRVLQTFNYVKQVLTGAPQEVRDIFLPRVEQTERQFRAAIVSSLPTNTPPSNVQPSIRPLQGDQQRNETGARKRRGKAKVPASLRDRDGPPLPNIKVSANDGARAREIEDKQVPGAKDTWIGTVAEYLAEFPDQTAVNDRRVEAFYDAATDRAVILIDRVVARDGDAIRAARNGTSAAVEAVRRLIRHESFVHRGWRALPQNLKTEFLAIAESLVPEEEINAIVAKGYSRYANWSTDPAVRALVVEEWLAQRLETLEKLPATDGGPLSRLIDWAKRVWQWLNGNDAVEPTRAELVDVMRQMIRALEIGEKSREVVEPIRPSFIGEKAEMSQFMRDSLETARSMAAAGKSSEEIRAVTGWFPGLYDGKMRWELPDNEAAFTAEADSKSPYLTIGQAIDNPALFEAYPDARNIYFKRTELGPNEGGYFDPIANRIVVNSKKSEDEQLSSALHEIQHWIQGREKFAEGASPDVFYWDSSFKPSPEVQAKLDDINAERIALRQEEVQLQEFFDNLTNDQKGFGKNVTESRRLEAISTRRRELSEEERKITKPERNRFALSKYRATAGEIEARDVQARRTMTPEQRRATAPYSSENIAPEDAIVIFDGREQGVMASLTDTDAAYMGALQGDNGSDNLTEQLRAATEADRQGVLNDWLARNPQSAATLQQRVDEAARAAMPKSKVRPHRGWEWKPSDPVDANKPLLLLFHGGEGGRNVFDRVRRDDSAYAGKQGSTNIHSQGIWLTPVRGDGSGWNYDADTYAANYSGGRTYSLFVNITNPATVYDSEAASRGVTIESLKAQGYDGAWMGESGMWVAFDPTQIKLSDPVTYDDAGNVIPPSQRFQPESPDIRFSLTDPTASNIIQDANQTTTEQQPTRSRPLSPETAPGRATEVLPTGEEIVERTQIDKTSMPRLEALAIKFVDSLGPVDTWPNKILNPAWWKANGGNMRDDFGQMVMAEALYRTGIGALQGNPTLVEVNDLISREYQTGATEAAKALASRSYVTTSERYGPMFAVQGMIDQRRRQQETVIDANVDVAAGVDAVNNADAQAQSDASAELDEELRLKDAIYELGLAARTLEIQTRIRRINDNVFRLGVLAQIREQLLSRVQASFVGLSRAAVEQQYASLSVEQIDAEIARLEREVADDVAAVEGERQRVRAAPKPKGAAADPITQARTIIARLEADPKTKKTPKANPVRDLYREHLKNPMAEDEFMTRMAGIGVPAAEAQKLYDLAAVKIAATEAVKAQREAESQEDSPAVAFAKRTIDDVASRLADPALPQEERQRKVLAIRELYKEHVRDGLPFDVFISRAEAAGVEGAMASTLHGVGMMEREARETTRGYNEAQAGQRFAEKTINDAATLYADPALPQPVRNKRRVSAQELYNKHVKKAMDQAEFLEAARKAGVNEATAMVLFNVGNMTREAREAQAYGRRLIERRERLLDAEGSALENLINNLRGKITGDLSWREMFDRPLETQRQWRRDLFAALRNDPALAGLTPQEIGDLVVEIDKVWEAKRKKNFEAQLKRMNLPGAKGNSKDKIAKSAPKLLRYINAGFFNDDAFRNAISEEFGIPALNEETVKQVVDLMQRAQADGITEVERKGLMIEAIRLMQRDLKAELGDILSNYWVTSVLSGFATQFDMAFSALNGMRVMAQSMADLAIRKREFKLAGRAGMAYLRALGNVILEAARYFYTGDPKLLDNYQYTLNTYLTEGSAAANPFDYFERIIKDPNRPSWKKIMPYFYAGMQRAMTAFDHINSTATTQGMLEMAMFYNRELYEGARMPSKEDVAAARAKAVEMAGGDKTWGQKREVSSYTRQILNELLNKKYPGLLDEARDIGKVVSYTNDPTGIGGIVYHTLLGVTNKYINEAGKYRDEVRAQQEAASRTKRFMANLNYIAAANARNLTGLRFVRFVGNRLNEILSFTPGLGLLRLQEKGMTPTMRAMIIQNQTVGLSLSVLAGVTILRALTDEEDDEKRGFRISGSWSSLPPDKKNQLRASGRSPYAIELWDGKKWTSFNYNAWPVASIIATAGNLNDQRLFNPEKWEEKDLEDKLLSAAWAGAFSFKDLSALSGFMDMIGKSAYSTDPVEGATQWISKFSSNYVGGFIPRMLKDIDLIMDSETRKARDFGAYFAKELPFYRRTEAAGEKLYNIFGEPVKLNRMPWRRAVTATREEPEYETLAELNRRGIFLGTANPSNRTVGSGANRRELTDAEAEKYMVETGKLYRDFIKQQGQSLLQLDRAQAEEVISKTTERLRAAALRMSIGATK